MKKISMILLTIVLIFGLTACGGGADTTNNNGTEQNKVEVVCDITKYANLTSTELIELLGEPDNIEKTTPSNGFVDIPCVYYDYNNTEELGEVSFVFINNKVAQLISYKEFQFPGEEEVFTIFNIELSENGAVAENNDTTLRVRCPSEEVDDFWISNIDKEKGTFDFLKITYDMEFFEEWYLPLTSQEEIYFKSDAETLVKSMLVSPKSADFPAYDWQYGKNLFYILTSSYVDSKNAFGVEMRTTFTIVYSRTTEEPILVIIDDNVEFNSGYVPAADLIKELVTTTTPVNADKQDNTKTPDNTQNNQGQTSNTQTNKNTQTATNDINKLRQVINGVCSGYNSKGNTPLNGYLNGSVDSATSVTIEHQIGDIIYSDTEYIIYQMEDKIYELFSDALNEDFPEYIDVYVYSTYDYVDCTKAEYEASWEYEEEYYYEEESDLDGIATELTDEELEWLEEQSQ